MIRGIAAAAVLTGHIRGLFFVDYPAVVTKNSFTSAVYALTGLGHQSVMIFFVLSGFFIGGTVVSALSRWTWKKYLVNRMTRLYLVLLPALALTAVLDYFAHRGASGAIYFDRPIPNFAPVPLAANHGVLVWLGNSLFLQTIAVPVFGSNMPLWSLANEFWYYLLFPCFAIAAAAQFTFAKRLTAGLGGAALIVFLPAGMLWGFTVWMLGVGVFLAPERNAPKPVRLLLRVFASALLAAALIWSRSHTSDAVRNDELVGLAFAAWLYCLLKVGGPRKDIPSGYQWLAKTISGCSYSVYAVHLPIVMLLRCELGGTRFQPTPMNLAIWTLVSVAVFLTGLLFSRLTEARTDVVRRKVMAATTSSALRNQPVKV